MQCHRCQGVMVIDYFVDLEASNEVWMPAGDVCPVEK